MLELLEFIKDELRKFNERYTLIDIRLSRMERLLNVVYQGELVMDQELANLKAAVAATLGAEQSAITLIQGLAAQISASASSPAAVQALADQLNAEATALAAAVTAGSPPAPAPEPAPSGQ